MKRTTTIIFVALMLTTAGSAFSLDSLTQDKKAALVQLSGTISISSGGSPFSSDGLNPSEVRDINEKISEKNYNAVIYEINSGGGTVVASKEIMRSIDSVEVPTVCRFRDVAASGAYLLSLGCDKIVADSSSITGSIGVKSSYLEFSELLKEHGIEYVNVSSGKYKTIGTPYKNLSEEEKEILSAQSKKVHRQFLNLVESNRNLSEEGYEKMKTGRIFLGSQAKDIGLVDELGGRETAKEVAENITGHELKFEQVETKSSFSLSSLFSMDSFFQNFADFEVPFKAAL